EQLPSGVVVYRWGTGPRVILLVHGWRSRASRFAPLVRALESPETTIVSFDAPANGATPGRFVTILDYIDAIRRIADTYGPLDTILGHSFGALASMVAVREGVRARRIVDVAGMYSADQLVTKFAEIAAITTGTERRMRRLIEKRTFPGLPNLWSRFVAEVDPADTWMPMLVIHDSDDPIVDVRQAVLIADAHTGPVQSLITSGLGHSRILSDAAVIGTIREFVLTRATPEPTR
ncbi:MAG TPA: alpha/beta hydrolase, partial [Rhodoglobus sp.]|nr:alpha/beta hydrolase [Rhodoglobus sp.]